MRKDSEHMPALGARGTQIRPHAGRASSFEFALGVAGGVLVGSYRTLRRPYYASLIGVAHRGEHAKRDGTVLDRLRRIEHWLVDAIPKGDGLIVPMYAFVGSWLLPSRVRRLLGGFAAGVPIGWAVVDWVNDVRLMGLRAVTNLPRMMRLRYRAPLWSRLWISEQIVGIFDLPLLLFGVVVMRDVRRGNLAPAAGSLTFLALRSTWVRTPTVVYLGASTAPNFSLFKTIQWYGGGLVLTAIDHSHPRVMEGRPLDRSDSPWASYFRQLPLYELPQPTNLRTATGKWQPTVRELIDMAPLVVLDVRLPAEHVLDELHWVTGAEGHAHKTILVTSDPSLRTVVSGHRFAAVAADADSCLAAIGRLTAKRATLPNPTSRQPAPSVPPVELSALMASRRTELRQAFDALAAADESNPQVLRRVAQLLRLLEEFAPTDPDGRPDAGLDRAVRLAMSWSHLVWLGIHVEPSERPLFEIGHGVNEAPLVTYSSAGSDSSLGRGLLAALLAAELRHAGAAATDEPLLDPPRWMRPSPLPQRLQPLGWLGDTHLGRRMRDGERGEVAAALAHELRASSAAQPGVEQRLHGLFGLTLRPETSHVATSVEAAITFVRRLGLGLSLYVTVDGDTKAELGTSTGGIRWRWQSEYTRLPAALTLILEVLRVFQRSHAAGFDSDSPNK